MLWIAFCQRRRALSGQGVDAGAMVNLIAGHIGIVPCALAHCAYAGQDPRGHFRRDAQFTAIVKDPHHIAICNPPFLGIDRVYPHFLTAGRLENIDIAVAGVRTGFVVEAKHLQWERTAFWVIPSFKR